MAASTYAPTETTAPVAATTAGLYTFPAPVSCIFFTQWSAQNVNVRFNAAATATVFDVCIASSATTTYTFLAKDYGLDHFSTVSLWYVAGATVTNQSLRGV